MSAKRVEVTRGSDLAREAWTFVTFDFPRVLLDHYSTQERKTRRHKWRPVGPEYCRVGVAILDEPDVPQDVIDEALEAFRAQLRFVKWKDRHR